MSLGSVRTILSPSIVLMYNASGAEISRGMGVEPDPSNFTTLPDIEAEVGTVTTKVPTIKKSSGASVCCGIAQEDISDDSWGKVCVYGKCKGYVTLDTTTAAGGCALTSASDGYFDGSTGSEGIYLLAAITATGVSDVVITGISDTNG